MERKNTGENGIEIENFKLNDMFSLSYNFDVLKYIINNLIKNQQKLNYKLIEFKIDKAYNLKKFDEIESDIIDLKQFQNKNSKFEIKQKKTKSKNYREIIDKLTKEKENYFHLIQSSNTENIILNEKKEKFLDEIKVDKELDEKIDEELQEEKNEEINDIYNKIEGLKIEIEDKINNFSKNIDEKIQNFDKLLSLINNNIKKQKENIDFMFSEEIPKIFDNLYSKKIIPVNLNINNINNNIKENIQNFENYKKEINMKFALEEQKYQDNIKENQKKFKDLFKQTSKMEKKMNDCVEIKDYNSGKEEIENKMRKDYKELANDILAIKQIIEKNQTDIEDIKNDKTNKNNILLLSKRCDELNTNIIKLNEKTFDLDSDRRKLADLDFEKYMLKNDFEGFVESNDKIIDNIKKYLSDMKYMIDYIKVESFKGKASIKDLKNLEDKIIERMKEFNEQINEKFAEKKFVLRNNRFLKIEIKQKLDNYKNIEPRTSGGNAWILSKKPMGGHLCASCESYIGDLKENDEYIPWNQIPLKAQNDKLSNINHVFSKMLQKLSTDLKIKRNKSTQDINSTKFNNENSLEDIEAKQCSTNLTNKRIGINLKDNIFEKKRKKNLKIKEIPKLKIKKIDNFSQNNKYKTNYNLNSKTERDENIILPDTVLEYNKNEEIDNNSKPKVIKIFRKL